MSPIPFAAHVFAFLIIALPSKFQGGEVHVSHRNNKDVFEIFPFSRFAISHEVESVISGSRLTIV